MEISLKIKRKIKFSKVSVYEKLIEKIGFQILVSFANGIEHGWIARIKCVNCWR